MCTQPLWEYDQVDIPSGQASDTQKRLVFYESDRKFPYQHGVHAGKELICLHRR